MKKILSEIGVNAFIAVKVQYNGSIATNGFYRMLKHRLEYMKAKELWQFLVNELHVHFKECVQYQN